MLQQLIQILVLIVANQAVVPVLHQVQLVVQLHLQMYQATRVLILVKQILQVRLLMLQVQAQAQRVQVLQVQIPVKVVLPVHLR